MPNQEPTDGFCGMSLIISISRDDIFISVTMSPVITGQPPGSRWERILKIIKSVCRHGTAYTKMIADYSKKADEIFAAVNARLR